MEGGHEVSRGALLHVVDRLEAPIRPTPSSPSRPEGEDPPRPLGTLRLALLVGGGVVGALVGQTPQGDSVSEQEIAIYCLKTYVVDARTARVGL